MATSNISRGDAAVKSWVRADTDWLRTSRWGVFGTFLADTAGCQVGTSLTSDEWNRRVDAFDVDGLARQLNETQASYFILTLGQNSGYYASPNRAYDEIVRLTPSYCSRRDLVADLARALAAFKIRMMVYLPSGAPANDLQTKERLKEPRDERLTVFQKRWEAVTREWSLRWGRSVHG